MVCIRYSPPDNLKETGMHVNMHKKAMQPIIKYQTRGRKDTGCVPKYCHKTAYNDWALKMKLSSGHAIALWKKRCEIDQKSLII